MVAVSESSYCPMNRGAWVSERQPVIDYAKRLRHPLSPGLQGRVHLAANTD